MMNMAVKHALGYWAECPRKASHFFLHIFHVWSSSKSPGLWSEI